jgi:hypothetical protein
MKVNILDLEDKIIKNLNEKKVIKKTKTLTNFERFKKTRF